MALQVVRFRNEEFTADRVIGFSSIVAFTFENDGYVAASFQFETEPPTILKAGGIVALDAGTGNVFLDGNYTIKFKQNVVTKIDNVLQIPEGYEIKDLDYSDATLFPLIYNKNFEELTEEEIEDVKNRALYWRYRIGDRSIKLLYITLG